MSDIVSSLDQPLQAGAWDDPEWKILNERIDRMWEDCSDRNSLMPAFRLANEYKKGASLQAVALARILAEGEQRAKSFGITRGGYREMAFIKVGLSSRTIGWYIAIWEELYSVVSKVPKNYRPRLLERPLRSQKEIVRMLREGNPKEKDWKELVTAEDHAKVLDITRRVRGLKPKAGGITIYIDREGMMEAWEGELEPVVVGTLRNSEEDMKNDLRRRAVKSIIQARGVIEK